MKKLLVVSLVLLFCAPVFAATKKQIVCRGPTDFSGMSAFIGNGPNGNSSVLSLTPAPNGAMLAKGVLFISIFDGHNVKRAKVKVAGQFDNINGTTYATLGALDVPSIGLIYLNFTLKNRSYLEFRDLMIPMNCVL